MERFKRSISIVLSLIVVINVFFVFSINTSAASYIATVNGIEYTYTLNTNGTANLECYFNLYEELPESKRKSITLPKKINGHKVVSIGYLGGFYDVEKIVIPKGVKTIEYEAFKECAYLKEIKFPNTIEVIERGSWIDGTLWYEKKPAGLVYIGKALFAYNYKDGENVPKEIRIKSGTKSITADAFRGMSEIKSIHIPNSVKEIGASAFRYCEGLKNLVLPINLEYIDISAIDGCSNLTNLYVSNHECQIEGYAFDFAEKFKIYGAKNSTAQKFAKSNKLSFVKLPQVKLSKTEYNYSGKNKTPSVKISTSSGKKLKNGTDYTLSYPKNRKNIGTYNVVATLKGRYKGIVYASFDIFPAPPKITKLKSEKNGFLAYIKLQNGIKKFSIEYSQHKKFKIGYYGYYIFSKRKSKVRIKWLTGGKRYYVRLRCSKTVGDYIYSSDYSKLKSVKTKK